MSDRPFVFEKNVPITCWMHQVYDPDRDGDSADAAGKYILQPSNNVIDQETGILYYVHSVDERFKHDIRPARLLVLNEKDNISIVSYGNDMFFLLYDDRTKPTLCNIDTKLIILGVSIHEYRLVRTSVSGEQEIISLYIDADGKVRGDRIPMNTIKGNEAIRFATNCHTTHKLVEGEQVTMQIFDTSGVQCASVTVFVRRGILQNDLASTANPIVIFDAECHQMRGEDFFVYEKQDPMHLNIVPYVIYADGTRKDLIVDNKKCFIHGLDDFRPSFPGYSQPLVIKYHLGARETSSVVDSIDNKRVMSIVKKLIVVDNNSTYSTKISVVPIWNYALKKYELSYFAYTDRRNRIHQVTDLVEMLSTFNGQLFGSEQVLDLSLDVGPLYGATDPVIHLQRIWLTLKPGNAYERYVIKDSKHDDFAYGVEATSKRRPVIHYDENTMRYFIPTTIFTSKDFFLENFYYASRPMYHPLSEDGPPAPTHFTIRSAQSGTMLITKPIPVTEYGQSWNCIAIGNTDQLVSQTLMVEFLKETTTDEYLLLYGVPVEVYMSQAVSRGGFNTPQNNLFEPIYL